MATFVIREGRVVERHLASPQIPRRARSAFPSPRVISDACEFQSMANGEIYTSKRAYEADIRARGLDIVGNDSSLYRDPTTDFRPVETNVAEEAALFAQHVGA